MLSDDDDSNETDDEQCFKIPFIPTGRPQRRILLVDDEPFNLLTLKDMIKLS